MRDNKIEENKSSEHFSAFKSGLADGIPIALGYLAVSFSFGILAVKDGLLIWQSVLISLTNLTSAGQVAGISIMTMSGGLFEMFLSQLVINIRYSLMSVALTQKTDSSFSIPARLWLSFGITDEIFGVASSAPRTFSRRYMAGLIVLPVLGWTLGTYLGAFAGNIFPARLIDALTICIFAMFIAIVVPPAKKNRKLLPVIFLSAAVSCAFYFIPALSSVSSGFVTIIAAVTAAAAGAFLFPAEDKKEETNAGI